MSSLTPPDSLPTSTYPPPYINTRSVPPPTPASATPTLSPTPSTTTRQVDIPSSTVISIGLGFVAFTFGTILLLFATRFVRVYLRVRRARADGTVTDFRSAWRREGGMFGFLSGFAPGGAMGMSVGAGGGGWTRLEVSRLREMYWAERERAKEGDVRVPLMWESGVKEREAMAGAGGAEVSSRGAEQEVLDREWNPLCAMSSLPPDESLAPAVLPAPRILISVLVAMPMQPSQPTAPITLPRIAALTMSTSSSTQHPSSTTSTDQDDFADLPDVAIGTCCITPMVPHAPAPPPTAGAGEKADGKGEVEQYEYAPPVLGRTRSNPDTAANSGAEARSWAVEVRAEEAEGVAEGKEQWRPLAWEKGAGGRYVMERTGWG